MISTPPRKKWAINRPWFLFGAFAMLSSFSFAEPLCTPTHPGDCPEVYSLPDQYGSQEYCGSAEYLSSEKGVLKPELVTMVQIEATSRRDSYEPTFETNYFKYFKRARIAYAIKCQNGILYQDTLSWEEYDHTCTRYINHSCSDGGPNLFEPADLKSYDPSTKKLTPIIARGWGMDPLTLPDTTIISRWTNRKVGIPKYNGDTSKLAVPLILINGIGEDYTDWGVTAAGELGTEAWIEGLVTDYENGSLPDVVSRAYGLAKSGDINTNGIYFVNLDYRLLNTEKDNDVLIENTLKRLEKIALQHLKFDDELTPSFKMDLVCHSTGCLVLNEALRNYGNRNFLGYPININDYIRNIVAIDAPHYGTALAKTRAELDIEKKKGNIEINGLPELHRELDGEATEDEVLDIFVQLDLSDFAWANTNGPNAFFTWFAGQAADLYAELGGFIGYDFTEYSLNVKGGLLGPHQLRLDYGDAHKALQLTDNTLLATRVDLAKKRQQAIDIRQKYMPNSFKLEHPRRSDGSFVPYVPFYSDNVAGVENEIIKYLSKESMGLLCEGISDVRCKDIQTFAEASLESKIESILPGALEDNEASLGPKVADLIEQLRSGWLSHSDLLVEKSSQVWDLAGLRQNAPVEVQNSSELKQPKPYTLHQSEVSKGHPDYPVLHTGLPLPFSFGKPSQQMGKDLFCALEPACDSLSRLGSNPLYTGEAVAQFAIPTPVQNQLQEVLGQAITLTDDFKLYPLNESGEISGFILQDSTGGTIAMVVYDKTHGTYVLTTEQMGDEDSLKITIPKELDLDVKSSHASPKRKAPSNTSLYGRSLLPPAQRPQFVISRKGTTLNATIIGQSGLKNSLDLASYEGRTVKLVTLSDTSAHRKVVLVGQGTSAIEQAPLPPMGSAQVILHEKKGRDETNTSRPWIWVANNDTAALKNLTLTYYFTADPARLPKVEMDYPRDIVHETIPLGGDHYKFVVQIPEISPKSLFPGESGLQIRLHYLDWTPWITADDYSAGTIMPLPAKKVVLRDSYGRLLWGKEPDDSYFTPRTIAQRDPVQLELSVADAGPYENNMLRPKVFVKHSGGPALEAGFKVVCFWKGLGRLDTVPTLKGWYSPDTRGQSKRLPNGRLQLEWTFENYRLYNGQQVSIGDYGIYWPDWTALDKSGFASAQWVVLDSAGNVMMGEWPKDVSASVPPYEEPVALDLSFSDAGVSESNVIRPHVTLAHRSGPVLLGGFTVRLELTLPGSDSAEPQLKPWYAPYAHGTLTRLANNRVRIEWTIPTHELFAGQTMDLGEWGIFWENWSSLDKTGLANAQMTVFNANGKEIARYGY